MVEVERASSADESDERRAAIADDWTERRKNPFKSHRELFSFVLRSPSERRQSNHRSS